MFIGYFTERPYQDPQSGYFGATGKPIMDLTVSNDIYDPELGAELYNRYLDEKIYAEEMGFDGLMLNDCLLYTSPSPRDRQKYRMPSSA